MFHLVSLSLQISLTVLACLGLCVGVACFVVFGWVRCLVSFFWGNLISFTCFIQLLTDHVSHLSGNAGKKMNHEIDSAWQPQYLVKLEVDSCCSAHCK